MMRKVKVLLKVLKGPILYGDLGHFEFVSVMKAL